MSTITVTLVDARRVEVALQLGSAAPVTVLDPMAAVMLAQQGVLVGPPGQPQLDRTHAIASASSFQPVPEQYESLAFTAQDGPLHLVNPLRYAGIRHGHKLLVCIIDDGTAHALTFDDQYAAGVAPLPTSTIPGETMYLGFSLNTIFDRWDFLAFASIP